MGITASAMKQEQLQTFLATQGWVLLNKVGSGVNAVVYEIRRNGWINNERRALRVIRKDVSSSYVVQQSLYPYAAKVHAFGKVPGTKYTYCIMDLMDENLKVFLRRDVHPPHVLDEIGQSVLELVRALQREKIRHGEFNAQNIGLLGTQAVMLDFDKARRMRRSSDPHDNARGIVTSVRHAAKQPNLQYLQQHWFRKWLAVPDEEPHQLM